MSYIVSPPFGDTSSTSPPISIPSVLYSCIARQVTAGSSCSGGDLSQNGGGNEKDYCWFRPRMEGNYYEPGRRMVEASGSGMESLGKPGCESRDTMAEDVLTSESAWSGVRLSRPSLRCFDSERVYHQVRTISGYLVLADKQGNVKQRFLGRDIRK